MLTLKFMADVGMGPDPCLKPGKHGMEVRIVLCSILTVLERYLRKPYLERVQFLVNGNWSRLALCKRM